MLGLDRRTLQIAWTLLLFVAFFGTIYAVRRILVIFALALSAFALSRNFTVSLLLLGALCITPTDRGRRIDADEP